MDNRRPQRIAFILFDGFELLDVFGPAEVFSKVPGLQVEFASADGEPVASSQGVKVLPDATFDSLVCNTAVIPGGQGTRALVKDADFLARIKRIAGRASLVCSICTGSAVLAAAGLLEGYAATSNKLAFDWATSFGENIDWKSSARWVHDRDRWTSSGVAAGIDMAVAFVSHFFGAPLAERIAHDLEIQFNSDPEHDPFAV
ncbi:DJ-1/PfpI family protein [uncultured Corynebacterium sp.]|uniref:DJ-1/PfpI family protein n=1 Tax=uncultured Corynebacterium sp. TaxID=159447 RepID=UPI0025F1597F|nr:DJ-1/PfpI family protein [uncultured Corynebacterium sp.]